MTNMTFQKINRILLVGDEDTKEFQIFNLAPVFTEHIRRIKGVKNQKYGR